MFDRIFRKSDDQDNEPAHPFMRPHKEFKVPLRSLDKTTLYVNSVPESTHICATLGTTSHKSTDELLCGATGVPEWCVSLPQQLALAMDVPEKTKVFYLSTVALAIFSRDAAHNSSTKVGR